ncbi:MAG: DedA family protein [Actinobacteria bacterium]|nr:DedA family protein [Actinomycetota bacterium]MSY40103.1 DedA family protein [Actinomycetota bacterium]MSZ85691.1 DedA family protein [Actinomycetota bacterium]MTA37072.1 DedA family protein [Actinomycetota bacterium]MTA48143.1 DedA family protein [Actinomycetota bacterium]
MTDLAASFDAQLSPITPFLLYIIIGAIIFIETAVLLAFFLPGDSILFSAGLVAASRHDVNVVLLCFVVFVAAFLGDQIGYVLGRTVGRPYLDKKSSPRIKKMIARAERFYEHSGWWAVVAARFFPWIRSFIPPVAGAAKMNYYKFLSANAVGALLWGVGITSAGFYAATLPWVKSSSYGLAIFFIGGSIVSATWNFFRAKDV